MTTIPIRHGSCALFTHYLATGLPLYRQLWQDCACGTIVKSRIRGDMKETEAMARRLLAFSPRLKKLEGKSCRITVATIASGAGHFPRERCLKALHQLYQTTLPATAE
ncbi:YjeJ family protein [Citrobacter enshiensis]|uniref:YjeJ family protein n=1 Tax=Citrobacter enshiensis TaxID=2971264 RepID=UPI00399D6D1D